MILIPGVIDTTTNFVEHPEVVANRICEAVQTIGDRSRVIAGPTVVGTSGRKRSGFATSPGRSWPLARGSRHRDAPLGLIVLHPLQIRKYSIWGGAIAPLASAMKSRRLMTFLSRLKLPHH
jgi:hypothetical protein